MLAAFDGIDLVICTGVIGENDMHALRSAAACSGLAACQQVGVVDLGTLDRHPRDSIASLIPSLIMPAVLAKRAEVPKR